MYYSFILYIRTHTCAHRTGSLFLCSCFYLPLELISPCITFFSPVLTCFFSGICFPPALSLQEQPCHGIWKSDKCRKLIQPSQSIGLSSSGLSGSGSPGFPTGIFSARSCQRLNLRLVACKACILPLSYTSSLIISSSSNHLSSSHFSLPSTLPWSLDLMEV